MAALIEVLLGSRARAAALSALLVAAQNGEAGLHLGALEEQTGFTKATIKRIIDDLVKTGLVKERKSGNRRYLSVDQSHPAFRPLSQLFEVTSGISDILSNALANDHRVSLALLFGSVAKGEENATSDIDLILVGSITLREAVAVISPLQERLKREVNPVVFTPEEFATRKAQGEHFVSRVLSTNPIILKGSLEPQ